MVRDFRYIIKRIIVGVGIALILGLIRGNLVIGVNALEVGSTSLGASNYTVTEGTSSITKTVSGAPWANWGAGYLHFSFTINKFQGNATSNIVLPRLVIARSGASNDATRSYVCSIGTVFEMNSTFNGASFSVTCPMHIYEQGLTEIYMSFSDIGSTSSTSGYYLTINGAFSYEVAADNSVGEAQIQGNATRNTITNVANSITANQNQNTQNIINNQEQNTQEIIDNQNSNTDKEIESQKVCSVYDKKQVISLGYLTSGGYLNQTSPWGITDYISIDSNTDISLLGSTAGSAPSTCFYNINKTLISCVTNGSLTTGQSLTIPNGSSYVRFSIDTNNNKPQFKICRNGNQAIADSQQEINNTLNNDNVDDAESEASSFFDDFQSDSHGLSGIITAPLRLLNSLSSSSCSPLTFPLPFVQNNVSLPCMSSIYQSHFSTFLSLYQLITTGVIGYWVLIKIFGHIKGMQNPKDDRIEVFDL